MSESCSVTMKTLQALGSNEVIKVSFSWQSSAGGAVTANNSTDDGTWMEQKITRWIKGKRLIYGITNPGSAAPDDNYDIVVNDANGVDLFGGNLMNRDYTNSETAYPASSGGVAGMFVIDSPLTMVVASAGDTKTGVLDLYFEDAR